MDDHQHAAQPLRVKGRQQQLQAAAVHIHGPVQIAGLLHRQHADGDGPAQQPFGGRIGLDDRPLPGKGHHAVGHMQEQRAQLIALVLHFFQRLLELTGHVVEGPGQHADLIPGGHLDFMGKVSVRHPLGAFGQPLDGGDQRLGQQEREQHGDHQPEDQRLHDQGNQLAVQGLHGRAVIPHIDDIAGPPAFQRHRHVHIGGGRIVVVPDLSIERAAQVAGELRCADIFRLVRARQIAGVAAVQHIAFAAAVVDPQGAVGAQDPGDAGRPVLLPVGGGGQVGPETGVPKGFRHLRVEVLGIIIDHRIDQKGAHDRHQRDDQQRHDEHQFHMQAAEHGTPPFRMEIRGALPLCAAACAGKRNAARRKGMSLCVEKIPHSPPCDDELRRGRVVLNLLTQPPYGHVHGTHVTHIALVIPDVLHEGFP